MANVIVTDIYRLSGPGKTFDTKRQEGIPVPFHVISVPVANQPATNAYVYSKIRWSLGNNMGGPMVEEAYSFETVAALVAKANA
jgi:hypothetical protein